MIILSWLAGCQGPSQTASPGNGSEKPVERAGKFPEFLVGTWKAETTKWQITLAPDANVVSYHSAGGMRMVMAEGSMFQRNPETDGSLYLSFGPCYADYDPATRELDVTITIEHFRAGSSSGALEGNAHYIFTGPVSEDGKKWDVTLLSFGGVLGQERSAMDVIPPQYLTFRKVGKN
jgi:hypothetical protein